MIPRRTNDLSVLWDRFDLSVLTPHFHPVSATKARKKLPKSKVKNLRDEYHATEQDAQDFAGEIERQLAEILHQARLPLAVPIERRVKTWSSIVEKIDRKELALEVIRDVHDLIGVRAILLFKRDAESASALIEKKFKIINREDTLERLAESQFGYSSTHFVVEVLSEWLEVPTLQRFEGLKAELQVRTVAQHLWAASSQVLQYKKEVSVPRPVRRAIYRVSALLEMIDLEFERVLADRDKYTKELDVTSDKEILNVDSLARVHESIWPKQNHAEYEDSNDLLNDLLLFEIKTPDRLRQILQKHRDAMLEGDARTAEEALAKGGLAPFAEQRAKAGFFYTWTGLTRNAMELEFGDKWKHYLYGMVLPITALELPKAIVESLQKANIKQVSQLAAATERMLLEQRLEAEDVKKINQALQKIGLRFGMSVREAGFTLGRSPSIEGLWKAARAT